MRATFFIFTFILRYLSKPYFKAAFVNIHALSLKRLDVVCNTREERELNSFVPDDWYVVENAGIDGIIIWQDKTGRIYQSMPNGQKEYIANSLAEYLDKQ